MARGSRQPAARNRGGESLPAREARRGAHVERTWNAAQLADALEERFGARVTPETIRQHLLAIGYRWKRTRYVPSREPDPEEKREAREEMEALKGGRGGRDHPEVPRRERLLVVPAPAYGWAKKGGGPTSIGCRPGGAGKAGSTSWARSVSRGRTRSGWSFGCWRVRATRGVICWNYNGLMALRRSRCSKVGT